MKGKNIRLAAILVLALLVFNGCTKTEKTDEEPFEMNFEHYYASSLDLKEQVPTVLIEVPLVRQSTGYSCGVACTQSILRYTGYDFDVREDNLASALGANDDTGTRYESIVELLNSKSHYSDSTQDGNESRIFAEARFNLTLDELCAYLDQRKPVICAIQAWAYLTASEYETEYDSGHYVIAIGYDVENIYFMDPSTLGAYAYIPKDEFIARWHDVGGEDTVDHFGIIITIKADYSKDLAYKME
ncbi:MAG TPA: C39 family peptidase [Bacillota bacterium]|nr:C39 family peptidase [Bacillota bacterium]